MERDIKQTDKSAGTIFTWKPGMWLNGRLYVDSARHGKLPKEVLLKKGKMYCPRHALELISAYIPGQGEREHFTECPEEHCFLSIYNGL